MKTVAKTLLFDANNKLLVLYRGRTHPRYAHHPDFPGGEVEEGESPVMAIRREIEEETGLIVDIHTIKELCINKINGLLTHVICTTMLDTSEPTITLSWEHEKFEWLSPAELASKDLPVAADDYYLGVLEYLVVSNKTMG